MSKTAHTTRVCVNVNTKNATTGATALLLNNLTIRRVMPVMGHGHI